MIFIDEARIFLQAGSGGKGCESYYRDKYMRQPRPDGGDGGHGGDIIFRADRSIQTLLDYRYKQHHKAGSGGHGSSKGKRGKDGKDCILRVPMGTIVKDAETDLVIRDLTDDQQEITVARGGRGGRGNAYKNHHVLPPGEGEQKTIKLELKVIADVGLIGFPNAGKSTLITRISKVRSKIANYPFTTKQPVLGFVPDEEGGGFIAADLPGLIEGAHTGRGLGDRFLRHAERTRILVHVVDMAGTEGRDPLEDYALIRHELESYSTRMGEKETLLVANKMDLPAAQKHLKRFQSRHESDIIAISAQDNTGIEELLTRIRAKLCQENSPDE